MMEIDQKIVLDINKAIKIQKNLSEALDRLRNKVFLFKGQNNGLAFAAQVRRNGGSASQHQLHAGLMEQLVQTEQMENIHLLEFKTQNQQIVNIFKNACFTMEGLVKCLTIRVKEWQSQFQLHYAKLAREPDLDKLAPWCAEVGQIMHKILHENFESWGKVLQNVPAEAKEMLAEYETLESGFHSLMTSFIQSTFLVCEQGDFFIKTLKKCFPTFRVRILAADFCKYSAEVSAHFVAESDLKLCFDGDDIDITTLEKKQLKITLDKKLKSRNKLEMSTLKENQKMECCFENLHFEDRFKRKQKKESKVHEEKFRIVFVTKMESKTIWTMSLPLVIITASNQDIASLASIMWQCFSTNVFSLQEEMPAELPWSSVAEMLKKKIFYISKAHNLTEGNIAHLKHRMFGNEDASDDKPVSLTEFCCGAIPDAQGVNFSFWTWFLGIYNLIEGHLLDYWDDDLIMGFVKKEDAEAMVLTCDRRGTFILRFSDKLLTDRDGYKNVLGRLTATVLCKRNGETKEAGNKRNIDGQHAVGKENFIEHVKIENCPPENLANILKDERKPLFRFLFPSLKPRKEVFDKHFTAKKDSEWDGYKNPSELNMSDLEQKMTHLDLSRQEANSPGSQADLSSETRILKKPRRSKEELEYGEKSSPEQTDYSMSPVYQDQSPAQSVPDPAFQGNITRVSSGDSVVPDSYDNSKLPTFIEGMDICETEPCGNLTTYQIVISEENLDKAVPCNNQIGRSVSHLDTSYSETSNSISSLEGNCVTLDADSADIRASNILLGEVGFSTDVADIILGNDKDHAASVNETKWLFVERASTQDDAFELEQGGAIIQADGIAMPNGNTTPLEQPEFEQLVQRPFQGNGENLLEVGSYGNEMTAELIGVEKHTLLDACTVNDQELESVLSQRTRDELKNLFEPHVYRKFLLLIKENSDARQTNVPNPPTNDIGQDISDLDIDFGAIETDSPLFAETGLGVEDIGELAEQDDTFKSGFPDLGDLDGYLS